MQMPDYNFLSAPLWLFNVLHLVTLTLHFIAMNIVVGGVVALLWGKFTDRWSHPIVQKFLKLMPTAMAATITLGIAPLLFVQVIFSKQIYSASIVSGWFWLGIVAVLIVTYYALYAASFGKNPGRKGLWLGISLIGLIYISFVYSTVFALAESPKLIAELYATDQSGLTINPAVGDWIFRWLHMLTGAVTVGGFVIGMVGRKNEEAYKVGRTFFLWGMSAAALFGIIYLFTLGEALLPMMRTAGIWALTVGIVLSAGSLHFYFKKKFLPAALMVGVSVLCMVITRHSLRLVRLDGTFDPWTIPVDPQWSVFALFLACFLIAIALVWYMVKAYFKPSDKTGSVTETA